MKHPIHTFVFTFILQNRLTVRSLCLWVYSPYYGEPDIAGGGGGVQSSVTVFQNRPIN